VVRDHEQRPAGVGELARERLAAVRERRVRRVDPPRAVLEVPVDDAFGVVEPAPGRSTKASPRSVRKRKTTRMLPPGSPPSWSFTGSIWR
jgi:hypothetical protein